MTRRLYVNATQTVAHRIVYLEGEIIRISARQHKDARRKDELRRELTELRCGLTSRDEQMLDRLRLEASAR